MPVVTPDLLSKFPFLTLPDGRLVSMLDEQLTGAPSLPPQLRQIAIQRLGDYLEEAYALPEDTIMDNAGQRVTKDDLIDAVSWQLAKFMRYSSPTRITEAVPALAYVTERYKKTRNGEITVVPTLYLGVALSQIEGEEERAITAFNEGFDHLYGGSQIPALNLIWARANFARMLRRMNRTEEAEEQEALTRQWILQHPYAFVPSAIVGAISDDLDTDTNILGHPDIVGHFGNMIELDSRNVLHIEQI